MGNFSSTRQRTIQQTYNRFYSLSDNNCIAWSSSQANDNDIVIDNSRVRNITIASTGTADQACVLNAAITTTVASQLGSLSQQTQTQQTDAFNDFVLLNATTSSSYVNQTVTNNISSITYNTCGTTNSSVANDNFIDVNSSKAGNVYVGATSSAISSCTVSNIISQQAFNGLQAQSDQASTTQGMLVALGGCLVVIVIAIIIVVAISLVLALVAKSRSAKAAAEKPVDPDQAILDELEKLDAESKIPAEEK